jgi:hypothetical protein
MAFAAAVLFFASLLLGLVLDDGHLAGFVSISDLARLFAEARPCESRENAH